MTPFSPPPLTAIALPQSFTTKAPHPSTCSFYKRMIDVAGSLVGLLILAIIFLPIAIAIKLDSPGPVFFTQQRCGLQGRRFTIFKFRTMVRNADTYRYELQSKKGLPFFVKRGTDFRVTRVGHFLRKTSLDEFPQFWNVLMGEMSLVGTRPPTLDEVAHYSDHHWQRLSVKPGMTGEWQISGRSTIWDFEEIVKLDLRYQAAWHPVYDLLILLKTVLVVLSGKGAA